MIRFKYFSNLPEYDLVYKLTIIYIKIYKLNEYNPRKLIFFIGLKTKLHNNCYYILFLNKKNLKLINTLTYNWINIVFSHRGIFKKNNWFKF